MMLTTMKASVPDFRSLGVIVRTIVLAEAIRIVFVFAAGNDLLGAYRMFSTQGITFEPTVVSVLVILFLMAPQLGRCSYRTSLFLMMCITSLVALSWQALLSMGLPDNVEISPLKIVVLSSLICGAIAFYFHWRQLALSPSWAESRLMALQARIQPHFLFNSLNSVLSLIRDEPRRAEAMLQDLADLFRALMSEAQSLVPFSQEIALAKAYVDIETIRFGDRLRVDWDCAEAPMTALVPSLFLQPLLENAIVHGLSPREDGGVIVVEARKEKGKLLVVVSNPLPIGAHATQSNKVALANITERLYLHFDVEGELIAHTEGNTFVTRVIIPI